MSRCEYCGGNTEQLVNGKYPMHWKCIPDYVNYVNNKCSPMYLQEFWGKKIYEIEKLRRSKHETRN